MKLFLSIVIATIGISLGGPANSQNVNFMSTPISNSCSYPNVVSLLPAPSVDIAPGASRVVTKLVSTFRSPHGNFFAAANHAINPGQFCFFHSCGPQVILLTCAPVGVDSEKNQTIRLELGKGKQE